jgi:hypothetical protein
MEVWSSAIRTVSRFSLLPLAAGTAGSGATIVMRTACEARAVRAPRHKQIPESHLCKGETSEISANLVSIHSEEVPNNRGRNFVDAKDPEPEVLADKEAVPWESPGRLTHG